LVVFFFDLAPFNALILLDLHKKKINIKINDACLYDEGKDRWMESIPIFPTSFKIIVRKVEKKRILH